QRWRLGCVAARRQSSWQHGGRLVDRVDTMMEKTAESQATLATSAMQAQQLLGQLIQYLMGAASCDNANNS
ncbi:MAG: hypothetical protein SGPRY_011320, partial [Prymnesium sp.]